MSVVGDGVCLVHCIVSSWWLSLSSSLTQGVWDSSQRGHNEPSWSQQKTSARVLPWGGPGSGRQLLVTLVSLTKWCGIPWCHPWENLTPQSPFWFWPTLHILAGPAPFPSTLVSRQTCGVNQTDLGEPCRCKSSSESISLGCLSALATLLDQCDKAKGTRASPPGGRGLAPPPTPAVDSPRLSSPQSQIEVFHNAGRRLQRESHMYAKPFKCESQTQSRCNFLGAYCSSGGQYTQFSYFRIPTQRGILHRRCR